MSWKIDSSHTQIQFTARHMMISKVRGEFEKFTGSVNLNEDNPANTSVDVQIDASSINTRDSKRDGHLRSADFFNVEVYPFISFKSKQVKVLDNLHALLTGDLTIRNVTREVTLNVEYLGKAKGPYGMTNYGFSADAHINRKDWGLIWNMTLETGGVLVSDEIEIAIEIELVQVPEEKVVTQSA